MQTLVHTPAVAAEIKAQADAKLAEQTAQATLAAQASAKPARQTRTKPATQQASDAKPAKQGKASDAKPASEASKGKGRQTRKAPQKALNFLVASSGRPSSGGLLYAFTKAWMILLGMDTGAAYPKKTIATIAGDTAVSYHIKQGNFVMTEKGLELSSFGKRLFIDGVVNDGQPRRNIDASLVEAWQEVMVEGKTNSVIKNADLLRKFAA